MLHCLLLVIQAMILTMCIPQSQERFCAPSRHGETATVAQGTLRASGRVKTKTDSKFEILAKATWFARLPNPAKAKQL
ncbi:hypothetical protein RHIZ404_140011 [Rhizobium sp. EC-SD404]|nr:hypothetical protein RHIZ404_140011 [Rhizobium sp. EC-SD404]